MIYHQNFYGEAAARAAFVSSSSLLHARTTRPTSPYSPRFLHAMLFLDFTLSVIESEMRILYSGISVETVQKRREADDNFKFTRYII